MNTSAKKVWFITGASRGFGLLFTKDALARGDSVVATARNPQQVIDAVGAHPNLLAVKLDVTNENAAISAAAEAIGRFGRIDVLVNNAGYGLLGAVEEASADEVKALYEANVFGLLHVVRAVTPYMRAARKGHIINISSIGGYSAYAGWGVYGSTKFAVEGLSESLYHELAPLGIHVTVVEPGFFRTDFLEASSLVVSPRQIEHYADTVGAMRAAMGQFSGQQQGDPAKLSKAIMTLADSAKPPMRLPLGTDTVAKIAEKNRHVEAELAAWLELAQSTDHDDVAQAA